MTKTAAALAMALLISAGTALAANFIEPKELKGMLDQKKEVILLDIQAADEFAARHLPGSLETNAFPAKKNDEKKKLDKALPAIKASGAPVVVICPRGKSGAQNSYDYLIGLGIPENRLKILKGGIADWPYKEMLIQGRK